MCLVKLLMAPESKMGFDTSFESYYLWFSEPVELLFKRGQESFYLTLKQGNLNVENEH